jgi:hypothetical protein
MSVACDASERIDAEVLRRRMAELEAELAKVRSERDVLRAAYDALKQVSSC